MPVASRSSATPADRAVDAVERRWPWVLAAMLALDGVLLLYMGRGTSFYFDEWNFVTQDYGGGIHSLLLPHVGNISVFPIAVYKVLFHLAGLNHYPVYRLAVLVLHLVSAVLIFVLASRRLSRAPALLATALILFLGAAWEDQLWAFQVGYMLSITGGLGAWVLIEHGRRRTDLAAMACLIVAAGSSSLGIAIMIGVAVELVWQRQSRRLWVVAVPGALYILWYLGYGESQVTEASLINAPGFAQDLFAAASGALVGRGLEWGRPLAVLTVVVVLWRLLRRAPVSPRLAGLLATGISLWVVTAMARSTISVPETSRYLYLGAVVIVLVGVELLRGISLSSRSVAIAAVLVLSFAITGLTPMHTGAVGLRTTSKTVVAELGALQLAAAHAPPGYQPDPALAPQITAGPYLHTVRAIGSSPAESPPQLLAAEPAPREAADRVLVALESPKLAPAAGAKPPLATSPPQILELAGGREVPRGGCVVLSPTSTAAMTIVVALARQGVLVENHGRAGASFAARRFGGSFLPLAGSGAPGGDDELSVSPDASPVPWQIQLISQSSLSLCRLSG